MSDRFYGTISFPIWALDDGTVATKVRDTFGYEVNLFPGCDFFEEKGVITFSDEQASYGRFEILEDILRKKGIPFDQSAAAYFDDSCVTYFRPELPEILYTYGDGQFRIEVSDIEKILDSPNLKEDLKKLLPPKVRPLEEYVERK